MNSLDGNVIIEVVGDTEIHYIREDSRPPYNESKLLLERVLKTVVGAVSRECWYAKEGSVTHVSSDRRSYLARGPVLSAYPGKSENGPGSLRAKAV